VAKRNVLALGSQFLGHVLPGILRPMRALWNEVIGFVFIALALWGLPSGWRRFQELESGNGSLAWVVINVVFVVFMLSFGISSFRRARKISRS
jgi:hypothetical protein